MAIQNDFATPPADGPVDSDAVLAGIPLGATISGMFLSPLSETADRLGTRLPSARPRYTRFHFYPLVEHVQLLLETCALVYPQKSVREALRKLGRGAPQALLTSTVGKVVLGSAAGPAQAVEAMAKAYSLNLRPGEARVVDSGNDYAIVELTDVCFFLDSHHVGAFEGLLRHVGCRGEVRVQIHSPSDARLLIMW